MIDKNFAELLCKIAWKNANNNKKESIDNWIKTIFDTKFDEFTKHIQKAAYITKKMLKSCVELLGGILGSTLMYTHQYKNGLMKIF